MDYNLKLLNIPTSVQDRMLVEYLTQLNISFTKLNKVLSNIEYKYIEVSLLNVFSRVVLTKWRQREDGKISYKLN